MMLSYSSNIILSYSNNINNNINIKIYPVAVLLQSIRRVSSPSEHPTKENVFPRVGFRWMETRKAQKVRKMYKRMNE